MQRTLVIMAKAPVLGRVKTRLAREVGAVEAARFYRVALARLLARLGPDPRWLTVVAVAPDTAHWPAPIGCAMRTRWWRRERAIWARACSASSIRRRPARA